MRWANLKYASLQSARLINADLSGDDENYTFHDLVLWRSMDHLNDGMNDIHEYQGADLSYANLSGADLSKANLCGAILKGATMTDINNDFETFFLHEMTKMIGTKLMFANLSESLLSFIDLNNADLSYADLSYADLSDADLCGANLSMADLYGADLRAADLSGAYLSEADLSYADLSYANLKWADLSKANLSEANMKNTQLNYSILIKTNLEKANLTGCSIYGISAWDLQLGDATQNNLIISDTSNGPKITVDNIEVAQFIYLLLNNEKIRDIITTITSKVVLILGRFSDERKPVLDAIREELRLKDYMPVMFDFQKSPSRNFIDTVKTLALMSRFIIVDITDPTEARREMEAIKSFQVPMQPIQENSSEEYFGLEDFKNISWFLPLFRYNDTDHLLKSLSEKVITPAVNKSEECMAKRTNDEVRNKL